MQLLGTAWHKEKRVYEIIAQVCGNDFLIIYRQILMLCRSLLQVWTWIWQKEQKSNFPLHLKHWSSTSSADEVLEHEIISFCMRKKMAKSLKLLISIIIWFNVSVNSGIPGRMVMSSDVITYDAIWQRWPDDDVRIELVYIF